MRLIFCPNGSLSLAVKDTRNATKQVMVVGNSLQIFVGTNNCDTINAIVNKEDTADKIL